MSIRLFAAILLSVLSLSAGQAVESKWAQKVRACYNKDNTQFNQCLFQFWTDVRADLAKGIPELKVPGLDPMTITNIDFNEQGTVVKVKASFKNVTVIGAGSYTPKKVTVDTKAKTITIDLAIPKLDIRGTYSVNGTILVLDVEGSGPFHLVLDGIDAVAVATLVRHGNGVKANSITVDFTIKNIKVQVDNLLGGDSVGQAVNQMLNDNSQQILEDVKPGISKKLGESILSVLGGAFLEMPSEAFIE